MRNPLITLAAALAAAGASTVAHAEPVLLISIDGLRPGDVLEAKQRGLDLPNLTRFVTEGSYASGVIGNLPTVTYPSHTTLLTGVAPARHGIVSNTTFDPNQVNYGGWYWYSSDIKVRTLWDAAHDAGLTTANVHWPVSVGARNVRWNLPQIWRSGHDDDRKLLTALATPGLVGELEHDCGQPYAQGIDESIEGDINRAKFAAQLIDRHKPGFITVYLTALDHQQHLSGPGSPEAKAVLQRIDRLVGDLVKAEQRAHADAAIAVVSDHGFAATDTEINLFRPFIDAGLITINAAGKVGSWEAMPWPSGGSIAVTLSRPNDPALVARVAKLLHELAGNPQARIAEVIDGSQVKAAGGNPQAAFYVNLAPGALAGDFSADAPLSKPSRYKGMHGYFPAAPEMRSTFMVKGADIARGHDLGQIDMRSIAPTLARLMRAKLPGAELPAMPLTPAPRLGQGERRQR